MAQSSRPPALRSNTHTHSRGISSRGSSPPPLSPRTAGSTANTPNDKEPHTPKKAHHVRRKSGTGNEKRAVRPSGTLTRRNTPQYVSKVVGPSGAAKLREKERERSRQEERDSPVDEDGESFPQFCMTCEKQFQPTSSLFLYCSESCRQTDRHTPTTPRLSPHQQPRLQSSFSLSFDPLDRDRDIIPRLSPTQARPRSYFNSDAYPLSHSIDAEQNNGNAYGGYSYQNPSQYQYSANPTPNHSSTALASLRELATALPPTNSSSRRNSTRALDALTAQTAARETSTVSQSMVERTSSISGVWNYIPFASKPAQPAYAAPSAYSYSQPTPADSYTEKYYNNTGSSSDLYAMGQREMVAAGEVGMNRPLPSRYGGSTSHRPRSVDLVTPFTVGGL